MELEPKHLVYLSDEMYLPIQYKGVVVKQPYYPGDGNCSVGELESICRQYSEYCHQQAAIKQNCMRHIVELKFGVEWNETAARQIALTWWNNMPFADQYMETIKWLSGQGRNTTERHPDTLTGREIEEIYKLK